MQLKGLELTKPGFMVSDNSGAENLDLKRRYYRKMDGQKIATMRTCLDISIPKRPIKYR
jgi:hypothetical protein